MAKISESGYLCPLDPATRGREFELLLACCRPVAGAEDFAKQTALADKGIDSDVLLSLAQRHKASSLLYCNLRRHPAETFDTYLLDELKKRHQFNTAKALRAFQVIQEVAQAKPGFSVFVLKGLDVGLRAYKDLVIRDVGDIDLLVPPDKVSEAYRILESKGWHAHIKNYQIFFTSAILRNSHHEMRLLRKGFSILELHWRPTYNPQELPLEYLQKSPVSMQANTGLPGFSNENLLIYLCIHGSKHGWGRLKWLFDLPNVVEQLEIDWSFVWQKSGELGVSFAVQQGLMLAARYCNLQLTNEMTAGFRHRISDAQWRSIEAFQSGPELWMEYPPLHLAIHIWLNRIATASRPRVILWYCLSMLNPSINDYELISLPRRLEPLYFVLRPFTWALRRLRIAQARSDAH